MNIAIPSIHTPFVRGGDYLMTGGLKTALEKSGHRVEIIRYPFDYCSVPAISELMDFCAHQNVESFNGYPVDKVIALQFPAYYVQHPDKSLWLMHQYRAVYDLFDPAQASDTLKALKQKIQEFDDREFPHFFPRFTMCRNISDRLDKFNHISAPPLYHPPAHEGRFYCDDSYDYIFFPSRLEHLKRQDLLIRAMACTRSPVVAVIAGEGGKKPELARLIRQLNLADNVCLAGYIDENEKHALYARSLGVFFGPYDEDYGYVTLEAMLSSKPVVTCTDSGGPLEFVVDRETGFVVDPEPELIGEKIDWLYANRQKAKEMGRAGRHVYLEKKITWDHVVEHLVQN